MARYTRPGVAGIARSVTPSGASALTTAFIIAAGAPIVPASPQPLASSGLCAHSVADGQSFVWSLQSNIEFKNGQFAVAGTDRTVPFAQIALAADVPHNYPIDMVEPSLDETAFYYPTNFTCLAGARIAEVGIDRDTGTVMLLNFTAADDFGRIINPLIVAGHNGRLCLSSRGMRLRRLALLQPRRGGSIGIVAISVQATGAPAFAAASSGGRLGSQEEPVEEQIMLNRGRRFVTLDQKNPIRVYLYHSGCV